MALNRRQKLLMLGGASLGLLALLVLNVQENRTIILQAAPPSPAPAENLSATDLTGQVVGELAAPRFSGRTEAASWQLSAARANQFAAQESSNPASGVVTLEQVEARLEPTSGEAILLHATSAAYNPRSSELELSEGLQAEGTAGGFHVRLSGARGAAVLNSQTLTLSGGVSATLTPR